MRVLLILAGVLALFTAVCVDMGMMTLAYITGAATLGITLFVGMASAEEEKKKQRRRPRRS